MAIARGVTISWCFVTNATFVRIIYHHSASHLALLTSYSTSITTNVAAAAATHPHVLAHYDESTVEALTLRLQLLLQVPYEVGTTKDAFVCCDVITKWETAFRWKPTTAAMLTMTSSEDVPPARTRRCRPTGTSQHRRRRYRRRRALFI
mmetsp:Transcript_46298/g.56106  ORF Transcript_46298/g.56106 Transcript_46298/m.56106 type:complete len:149 (+) Transcript_46298:179-625(+)